MRLRAGLSGVGTYYSQSALTGPVIDRFYIGLVGRRYSSEFVVRR